MPTVRLSPVFNGWQGFNNNGQPLNGGLLYTYAAGTGTPLQAYTSSAGNVGTSFPIVLDSAGRPPYEIWLAEGSAYKFLLVDNIISGNILGTFDNIVGIHDFVAGAPAFTFAGTQTFSGRVNVDDDIYFRKTSGARFFADFSNATISNRLLFETSTLNGNTDMAAIPNGAGSQSSWNLFNSSDTTNAGFVRIAISTAAAAIQSTQTGGGTALPITFSVGVAGTPEMMRLSLPNNQLLVNTSTESPVAGAKLRVNGIVQVDNSCAVAVHRNGVNQVGIANNTFTKIQLTTKRTDQNNNFDNTVNYRWTPPAGTYAIVANAQFPGVTANGRTASIIYKNGAALFSNNVYATLGQASGSTVGGIDVANGTDFYELWCWHLTGGVEQVSGLPQDTYLTGVRIG
jgi:hypothetical protein